MTTDTNNEVARLRAEVQRAIEDRNRIGIEIRGEYLPKLKKSENEVERLRDALKSCFWATNTYDGNYARACDNVATIVTNALKTQDDK